MTEREEKDDRSFLRRSGIATAAVVALTALELTGCSFNKKVVVNNGNGTSATKAEASVSASVSPSQIIEGNSATINVTVTGVQGEDLNGGSITYGNLGSATISQGPLDCVSNSTSCTETDTITDNSDENLQNISIAYNGNANYLPATATASLDVLPTCTGAPAQGRTVNGTVLAVATANNTIYFLNGINSGTPTANVTTSQMQVPNPGTGTQNVPHLTTDGKYIYTVASSSSSPTNITNEVLDSISMQGQVVSSTPIITPGQPNDGSNAYAKAGPDGTIYIIGAPYGNDITTVTPGASAAQNTIQFQEQLSTQYGLEFSPNQKCGYAVMLTANNSGSGFNIFSSGLATFGLKEGMILDQGLPVGSMTSVVVNPNGKNIYGIIDGTSTNSIASGAVDIDVSNPQKLAIRRALSLYGNFQYGVARPSFTSDGSVLDVPFDALDTSSGNWDVALQAFNTVDDSSRWLEYADTQSNIIELQPLYGKVTPDNTKNLQIMLDKVSNELTLVVSDQANGNALNQVDLGVFNGIKTAIKMEFGKDQNGAMDMVYITPSNTQNQIVGYNWVTGTVTFGASLPAAIVSSTLP